MNINVQTEAKGTPCGEPPKTDRDIYAHAHETAIQGGSSSAEAHVFALKVLRRNIETELILGIDEEERDGLPLGRLSPNATYIGMEIVAEYYRKCSIGGRKERAPSHQPPVLPRDSLVAIGAAIVGEIMRMEKQGGSNA